MKKHEMSQSISAEKGGRAPRVKLAGVILALIQLDNPLDEGIEVQVIFHLGNSTVRSKAAVLFPMWATQGCLQPFEFKDLAEENRRILESDLQGFLVQSSEARAKAEDGRTPAGLAG